MYPTSGGASVTVLTFISFCISHVRVQARKDSCGLEKSIFMKPPKLLSDGVIKM